jgi:hypothetical protein
MSNHILLLIQEETEDLAIILRRIGSSYVYRYNYKYEQVWQHEIIDRDIILKIFKRRQ